MVPNQTDISIIQERYNRDRPRMSHDVTLVFRAIDFKSKTLNRKDARGKQSF
jgi:hypothetical protein